MNWRRIGADSFLEKFRRLTSKFDYILFLTFSEYVV